MLKSENCQAINKQIKASNISEQPELLTVYEVATYLRSSQKLVRQLIKSKRLKAWKICSRRTLIHRKNLDAFVATATDAAQGNATETPQAEAINA